MEEKKAAPAANSDNDKLMGVLAYLGILCLIPLVAAKDSKFAQYHAKQGLTLFLAEIFVSVLYFVVGILAVVTAGFGAILFLAVGLVGLGTLILSIIGIVNVLGDKMEPLPIIGNIQVMK